MKPKERLLHVLVRCYPLWWRERYQAEMSALIDDREACWVDGFDVIRGVVRAWLRPTFRTSERRLRATAATVFCAFLGVCLAGAAFAKTVEDPPFRHAEHASLALAATRLGVIASAGVLAVAVAVGALPLFGVAVRQVVTRRDIVLARLLLIPPIAAIVWVAGTLLLAHVLGPNRIMPRHTQLGLGLPYGLFTVACVLAGAIATVRALRRLDVNIRVLRWSAQLSRLAATAMVLAALLTAGYTVALATVAPTLANEWSGPFGASVLVNLVITSAVMAIAAVVAVTSSTRNLDQGQSTAS